MLKLISLALACAVLPVRGAADEDKVPALAAGDRKAAEISYRKAKLAFDTKNFPEAAQQCDDSMKADPSYPEPVVLRGCVQVEQRDFTGARESFLRAKKLVPDNFHNDFNLAEVDFVEKKWPTAKAAFEAILKHPKISDEIKGIARFKVMIAALKSGDRRAMEIQHDAFKKEGAQRELAFTGVLLEADAGKLSKEAFTERSQKLEEEFKDGAPYYDSMMEAYYVPAP